jgi:Family of unknown function (DUF6279)
MITMSSAMIVLPSRRSVLKRAIIAALVVLAGLVSGCSVLRVAYSQAPDLAYWWLDGYVDFDDTQTPLARDALARWFAWHRRAQLPAIAEALSRVQVEILADTTPERACTWWAWLRERGLEAADRAVPATADLMIRLTPAQVRHLERRQEKANAEFRDEYLAAEPAERQRATVERAVERAETVYGRLEDAQRGRIAAIVATSPFDADTWFGERLLRQRDTVALLQRMVAERPAPEAAQAAVRAWVAHVERSPREAYRRYTERLTQFNCSFAASLHNSTTPAQRQAAAQKLRRWELDLRAVAVAD